MPPDDVGENPFAPPPGLQRIEVHRDIPVRDLEKSRPDPGQPVPLTIAPGSCGWMFPSRLLNRARTFAVRSGSAPAWRRRWHTGIAAANTEERRLSMGEPRMPIAGFGTLPSFLDDPAVEELWSVGPGRTRAASDIEPVDRWWRD
jgi:hypothetical protein